MSTLDGWLKIGGTVVLKGDLHFSKPNKLAAYLKEQFAIRQDRKKA